MEYFDSVIKDFPGAEGSVLSKTISDCLSNLRELLSVCQRILSYESFSRSELATLHFVASYPMENDGAHITPAELSKLLGIQPSAVSRMLGSMSKQGLVKREISNNDRRVVHVSITDEGERVIRNFLKQFYSLMVEALGEFSQEEQTQAIECQGKFVKAVKTAMQNKNKL